jgi:hypothetical protein
MLARTARASSDAAAEGDAAAAGGAGRASRGRKARGRKRERKRIPARCARRALKGVRTDDAMRLQQRLRAGIFTF